MQQRMIEEALGAEDGVAAERDTRLGRDEDSTVKNELGILL